MIAASLYVANGYITLSAHHRLITIFAFLSPQNYGLSAQGNLKLEILEFCACSGKLLIHTLLLRKRSKCAKKISLKGLLFVAKRLFRVTCSVEAFDIFHQLSSTQYIINAQGRTETWNRTLPNYVMLHMSYHFSRKPKRQESSRRKSAALWRQQPVQG